MYSEMKKREFSIAMLVYLKPPTRSMLNRKPPPESIWNHHPIDPLFGRIFPLKKPKHLSV